MRGRTYVKNKENSIISIVVGFINNIALGDFIGAILFPFGSYFQVLQVVTIYNERTSINNENISDEELEN